MSDHGAGVFLLLFFGISVPLLMFVVPRVVAHLDRDLPDEPTYNSEIADDYRP